MQIDFESGNDISFTREGCSGAYQYFRDEYSLNA